MAETIETLVTEFRADIKRYEAQLRRQVKATQAAAAKNQRVWAASNKKIQLNFQQTASRIRSSYLVLGAAVAAGMSTSVIADFGKTMATVEAVTGAAAGQMDVLTAKARALGASTVFSASETGDAMLFLARAGFDVDQIMGAIEPTLRLAQAGAIGLGDAADIASNILQAMQLPVEDLTRVVDVMAKTTNSSNTDIRQLGDAMKLVAPISATFGVSVEDTAAAVGALSDAGMQATLAGTGLRRIMGELQSPTAATKKILKEYGLDAEDVTISTHGLSGALKALSEAGFDANRSLEVFGQRGGPAFANIFAAFESGKLANLSNELKNASGTASDMARIMDDTLAGAMKRALSRLQEFILTLGELGAEDALIDFFTNLANLFDTMAAAATTTARAYSMFVSSNKDLTAATYAATDALSDYSDALENANGKTGYALEYANSLADARREQALTALQAAQAERALEIEARKSEVRGLKNKLGSNQRGGTQFRARQEQEIREASMAVGELEKKMRETEDAINRILNGTFTTRKTSLLPPIIDEDTIADPKKVKDGLDKFGKELSEFLDQAGDDFARQLDLEKGLISELADARDEAGGRIIAQMDREFEARKRQIEEEIKNERRKSEALLLLAEERALKEAELKKEVLGQGEYSDDPVEQLRAQEQEKLDLLDQFREAELVTLQEYEARKLEIIQGTEDAIAKARGLSAVQQISAYENLFGSMADLAANFAGEQSGIYKALFAVEKAFAIASSIIAIQTGIANALSLPFPANLGAAATVAAQGASVVSNIRSVSNFRDGGVNIGGPGTGRSDSIPAMISRGESVITASGTRKNQALLSAINAGADVQGALGAASAQSTAIDASVTIGSVTNDNMDEVKAMLASQRDKILGAIPGISRATRQDDKRRGRA